MKKLFGILKSGRGVLDIAQWNLLGIIRFHNGLTKRVTVGGYLLGFKV